MAGLPGHKLMAACPKSFVMAGLPGHKKILLNRFAVRLGG